MKRFRSFLVLTAILLTTATQAAPTVKDECSWDNPGVNPWMGDIPSAVDNFKNLPAVEREVIKKKMESRKYDDIVLITRYGVSGTTQGYADSLEFMHYGDPGRSVICKKISRSKWPTGHTERGLVYCDQGEYCVVVPTVCRNVSLIKRKSLDIREPESLPPPDNHVPEPETLALVLAGLVLCLFKTIRKS